MHPLHPSFANKQKDEAASARPFAEAQSKWRASGNKREAERRKAHCPTNVRVKRGCVLLVLRHAAFRRSRSRHSPPVPPDGSAPEPGFPRRWLAGVLPASPKIAAVKHAPCGPVFVPADRGPRAARVRIGKKAKKSARGHRVPLRCYGLPSGTAPFTERDDAE